MILKRPEWIEQLLFLCARDWLAGDAKFVEVRYFGCAKE